LRQAFPREFDVGVTWKQPTVMKSHPTWLPIKSCLMLFHKERLQGGVNFLKSATELFESRYADDYWKGDERVLREIMLGARALLPASEEAAWTSDFQGSQVQSTRLLCCWLGVHWLASPISSLSR